MLLTALLLTLSAGCFALVGVAPDPGCLFAASPCDGGIVLPEDAGADAPLDVEAGDAGPCPGDPCVAGGVDELCTCKDTEPRCACVLAVCQVRPACCTAWDALCTVLATDKCPAVCGDGGASPMIVTVCGVSPTCPAGYTGAWLGSTPTGCGGNGCAAPGSWEVCVASGIGVAVACDLAVACATGRQLHAVLADCNCPGGSVFFCW
jgi:hypothetical protein